VQSFELLSSPASALWHPQLRKTCSKRAIPRPRADLADLTGGTRSRRRPATARGPRGKSGAGPSGAGARLAASATAVTRSQRASESAYWRHWAGVTGETRGRVTLRGPRAGPRRPPVCARTSKHACPADRSHPHSTRKKGAQAASQPRGALSWGRCALESANTERTHTAQLTRKKRRSSGQPTPWRPHQMSQRGCHGLSCPHFCLPPRSGACRLLPAAKQMMMSGFY